MIDQICSMALTNAHHEGSPAFTWKHLVDAMTVIESGTAINVKYTRRRRARRRDPRGRPRRRRARLLPERRVEPPLDQDARQQRSATTSRSRRRSASAQFQSRMFGELIHVVGAMAAELVFYGENSIGVGGDLQSTTWIAPAMVGAAGMSPLPIDLNGKTFADETEEQTRERVQKRLEDIGAAPDEPHRRRLGRRSQRSAEARLRRAVHRRGVRDRLQPDPRRTRTRSRPSRTP